MGYEVIFHYKEQIERGVYGDEEKTKKLKVGSPYDEVPLEALAGKIFAQLARRNILIEDIEIYEFHKKKLSYKETTDGVLIKNKKFRFDDGMSMGTSAEETEDSSILEQFTKLIASNPELVGLLRGGEGQTSQGIIPQSSTPPRSSSSSQSLPHEKATPRTRGVMRNEIYDPPSWLAREAKQRGLKFTQGKQYPILQERVADNPQAGMVYSTIDDEENKASIASIHFISIPVKLEGRFVEGNNEPLPQESAPNLSWDGVVEANVPNLR